jgi:putative membrane protein
LTRFALRMSGYIDKEKLMKLVGPVALLCCSALLAVGSAKAQESPSVNSSPGPAAASSPHQRSVTGSDGGETPTAGGASADSASSPHQQGTIRGDSKGQAMAADRDGADPAAFVKKATQGGMTEVALSKAAASKSRDASVKKFAKKMVQDHSKANDELTALAKGKGLEVPSSLDAEHQAIVQNINNKSGADFDTAYSKQMVTDHAKTVALFDGATQSRDTDLAVFAKKTLPILRDHKQLAGKLPGSGHTADDADPASKM